MRLTVPVLIAAAIAVFLFTTPSGSAGEPDLAITGVSYITGEGHRTAEIPAGYQNATLYHYQFTDNLSLIDENWTEPDFDAGGWDLGAAPFGTVVEGRTPPGTVWDTSDYVVARHIFHVTNPSTKLDVRFNAAFDSHFGAWLNGHPLFEEQGGLYHPAYYWNADGFLNIDPAWLIEGKNILAIYGHKQYVGFGHNLHWLDVELSVSYEDQPEIPIILGDGIRFKVDVTNLGNTTDSNISVNLTIEGSEVANVSLPSLAANASTNWVFHWTPETLGDYNLTFTIAPAIGEAELANNTFQRQLHVGFYAYDVDVAQESVTANPSENVTFQLEISNRGDYHDNFTFLLQEAPPAWLWNFNPVRLELAPGGRGNVTLTISIDEISLMDNYSLAVLAISQYYREITEVLQPSGLDNGTLWRWTNSTEFEPVLYDNSSWTELDFSDFEWATGAAPFGDTTTNGIPYDTWWNGSNYAYFRHHFTIENVSRYSSVRLFTATNSQGTHYLNGRELFNETYSHGARYWGRIQDFDVSYLRNGSNVIATEVRNTGPMDDGTQWFDQQLLGLISQPATWGFQLPRLNLNVSINPCFDFAAIAGITNKEIPRGENYTFRPRIDNRGNVAETYDIIVTIDGDTEYFIFDENYTTSLIVAAFSSLPAMVNVTALPSAPDEAVVEFNFTVTSRERGVVDSTGFTARIYVPPNVLPPRTHMTAPALVNETWFMVAWDVDADYLEDDTVNYTIFYEEDGGTGDWSARMLWDVFTNLSAHFHGQDGWSYRFACEGTDDADNRENKLGRTDAETLVDLTAPVTWLNLLNTGTLTNATQLELGWGSDDTDIVAYELQVRKFFGGLPTSWIGYDFQVIEDRTDFNIPGDGIYEFRMVATDLAGNRLPPAPQLTVVVDTTAPTAQLAEQPSITSADDITLALDDIDTDVAQYRVYYAVDSITSPSPTFPAWQSAGGALASDETVDIDLLNGMIYYFRALPTDEAGNSAYRGRLTFTYVGDGTPGQLVQLPLPVVEDSFGAEIEIEGDFTIELGTSPTLLLGSQCYLDARAGTLLFGNGSTGYQPAVGEVIEIAWEGYDLAVVVDRSVPAKPSNGLFSVRADEATGLDRYVTLSFSASTSDDIVAYRIYRSTNESETGILIATLPAGDDLSFSYEDAPTQLQPYWYHVMSEDAVGHLSPAATVAIDLTPVENTASITSEAEDSIMPMIAALAVVLVMVLVGGVYAWRNPAFRDGLLASFRGKADEADLPPVVAAAEPTADLFRIIGVELMCNGCGRLFTPPGEEETYCPGCGIYGKVPGESETGK